MNALIRKEIRLILPAWVAAVILATAPVWFMMLGLPVDWRAQAELAKFSVALGAIFLGLAPFGQECSFGTFSLLLAQPTCRRGIWTAKIAVVTAALVSVLAVFLLSYLIRMRVAPVRVIVLGTQMTREYDLGTVGTVLWCALATMVAAAGGLWTTLLFRQVAASVWFTLLVPLAILVFGGKFWERFSERIPIVGLTATLFLYSVAGFWWARRMFLQAQDTAWTGGTLSLPTWLSMRIVRGSAARPPKRKPIRALIRKEFQAHHLSLLIAAGLLFLHWIVIAIRRLDSDPTDPNSVFRSMLEFWWVLWLGLPFLVGSAAIAEERKLGTLETHLCLPTTRRAQFAVKLGLALLLGVFLGGLMPWVAEGMGGFDAVPGAFREARRAIPSLWQPLVMTCLIAAGITLISFYASTLTRTLLQAMGLAIAAGFAVMTIGAWGIQAAVDSRHPPPWGVPLIAYSGVPVILAALIWLAFKNYKHVQVGRNIWLRNALTIFLALAFTFAATATIYRRSWEVLMTVEPRHGPAQMSGSVRPTICSTAGRKLFALLPDGRLWAAGQYETKELDEYVEVRRGIDAPIHWEKARIPVPVDGAFLGASNWIALASSSIQVVGIQSDGSLWRIFSQPTAAWHPRNLSDVPEPERIGRDLDWKAVAGGHSHLLAVKKDGTLWGWRSHQDGRPGFAQEEFFGEPVRIGTDSDWVSVFASGQVCIVIKRDGSVWKWDFLGVGPNGWEGWKQDSHHEPAQPVRWSLNGAGCRAFASVWGSDLVLQEDGTLMWIAAGNSPNYLLGERVGPVSTFKPIRLGRGSDWADVATHFDSLAAIDKAGALFLQSLGPGSVLWPGNLRKPSHYSDWAAIGGCGWQEIVALAADGTLCAWGEPFRTQGLLGPTRKPLWSINIFAQGNSSRNPR